MPNTIQYGKLLVLLSAWEITANFFQKLCDLTFCLLSSDHSKLLWIAWWYYFSFENITIFIFLTLLTIFCIVICRNLKYVLQNIAQAITSIDQKENSSFIHFSIVKPKLEFWPKIMALRFLKFYDRFNINAQMHVINISRLNARWWKGKILAAV